MHEVKTRFTTNAAFLAASPLDLGLTILKGVVSIIGERGSWSVNGPRFVPVKNLISDIISGYPDGARERAAAADALAWLFSHDLVSELHQRGAIGDGTIIPTSLGYEIASISPNGGAAHAMRAIDLIHPSIRQRVVAPLISGEYDVAIINTFKAVEVRMRERAQLSTSDFGSRLARKFLSRVAGTSLQREDRRGNLTDEEYLFVGMLGMYRDRAVHEGPHVNTIEYALEVVVAGSHLLRIVEAATIGEPIAGKDRANQPP